ncbi:MAG TPA: gfo/Idh/MocA family oxidoreductase [Paenibacillus sp.]|uniref:Gfo/Idh/MocA family protein n=1 Tax=Paenibacillus TaxID=44249 RepID=UPI000B9FD0EB|nr:MULTISPECIES: Gfo/Idh/MocA family oxidoreductase [Paenibacillus]OZQ74215.1 oxidoreductase [Paenibacillus taichungensis]HBU82653.1 gfo/Idh/MocA family oxidoreductase [Paenibacillus sp.]
MKKLRIGIIGMGNMGSDHAKKLINGTVPEVELTAVSDMDENRIIKSKAFLPETFSYFTSSEELINSGLCDAVIIATPHYDHPRLAIKAFSRGLHVLCEKPAGVYTKQVREMNEKAKESGVVFCMMFNQRTNPMYRKMRDLVQGGELGAIKRVNWIITDWYRTQAYYDSGSWRATWAGEGGGVLINQCPHNIDLLQWICGMPAKVRAFCHEGKWHDIEVEDDVTAYLEFPNGSTGVFVTTTADLPGTNRLEITLEMGKLVSEHGKLTLYKLSQNEREYCFKSKEGFKSPSVDVSVVPVEGDNSQHMGIIASFAKAILHGTPLIAEGEEGINSLMLSNAMHLSSWIGETVEFPIDEDLYLDELKKRISSSKKKSVEPVLFDTTGSFGS